MNSLDATIIHYQRLEDARTLAEFDACVGVPLCAEHRSPWRPGLPGCGGCPVAALLDLDEGEECRVAVAEFGIWRACTLGDLRAGVRLDYPLDLFHELDLVEWLVGSAATANAELVELVELELELGAGYRSSAGVDGLTA